MPASHEGTQACGGVVFNVVCCRLCADGWVLTAVCRRLRTDGCVFGCGASVLVCVPLLRGPTRGLLLRTQRWLNGSYGGQEVSRFHPGQAEMVH